MSVVTKGKDGKSVWTHREGDSYVFEGQSLYSPAKIKLTAPFYPLLQAQIALQAGSGKVYVVRGGKKHHISNRSVR